MGKKKIRVGFDFDGVIAYNPFRIIRSPIVFIKKHIFGFNKMLFYYPRTKFQQLFWIILHESSIFPSKGADLLEDMIQNKLIEAHLITGRYSFLDTHLDRWLKRNKMHHLFKSININKNNEQPHLFKEKTIKKLGLDIFIEDNWDIVSYLNSKKVARIYWIYNILDRTISYKKKFSYIQKALEDILIEYKLK